MSDGSKGQPKITAGLDLGDKYSYLCLIDTESGEVVEEGRLRTTPEALRRRFCSEQQQLRIARILSGAVQQKDERDGVLHPVARWHVEVAIGFERKEPDRSSLREHPGRTRLQAPFLAQVPLCYTVHLFPRAVMPTPF
jgi:hypothetical protein